MLAHEWRELEVLCERLSDLRHRFAAAQKTKNVGLIEGLRDDIARVRRQRELLVQHISARLGSAAADHSRASQPPPAPAAERPGPALAPRRQLAGEPVAPESGRKLAVFFGFQGD